MMKTLKINQKEWIPAITKYIIEGSNNIGYVVVDTPVVIVHRRLQVDEAVCKNLGYTIVESYNNAGTIVSNEGDILIGHTNLPENGWYNKFVAYFIRWLKSKGLNAKFVDNDILVDEYKVCGICITRYGCIDYTGGIISINTKLDHIKQICRKPMKKVPKGLSEYGITTEEVEQMFLDFCRGDAS